ARGGAAHARRGREPPALPGRGAAGLHVPGIGRPRERPSHGVDAPRPPPYPRVRARFSPAGSTRAPADRDGVAPIAGCRGGARPPAGPEAPGPAGGPALAPPGPPSFPPVPRPTKERET